MRAFVSMLATVALVVVGVGVSATPASAVTVISGTVTLGTPPRVAGSGEVDVQVFRCTGAAMGCTTPVLSGSTDASGVYRVYNLSNGYYTARATHYLSKFKAVAVPFEVTTEQPSPVVDISMAPANTISGVVTLGASGPAGAGDVRVGLAGATARFPTDASGRFTIPDVQDGSYKLQFDYVGSASYVDQWSGGALREYDATTVAVASDTVYDITLPPGGVLSGTVTAVAPSLAEGMSVIAETYGLALYTTVVRADGSWTISGLPDRTFSLRAYDGRIGATVNTMYYGASSTVHDVPVTVVGASTTTGLDIVMVRARVLTGRVYCDGCRAGWSGGSGYVALEALTPAGWKPSNGSDLLLLPNAEGAYYDIRPVYPGTYRLSLHSMERTFRTVTGPTFEVTTDGVTGGVKDFTFVPTDPARDFDGDSKADVIARDAAGKLYLYRGNGRGGWLGSKVIGSGWQGFTQIVGPGNFDGDQQGTPDVLAQAPNGDLYLYRGNGAGGWSGAKVLLGRGLTQYGTLISAGDFDGDLSVDLITRTRNGELYLLPTDGVGHISGWNLIGSGWNALRFVG